MKKHAYKSPKGASFRTYFHGNRQTNGCAFRKVAQKPRPREKEARDEQEKVF